MDVALFGDIATANAKATELSDQLLDRGFVVEVQTVATRLMIFLPGGLTIGQGDEVMAMVFRRRGGDTEYLQKDGSWK